MTEFVFGEPPQESLRRVKMLHSVWEQARGERRMPRRADIDPAAIGADVLPYVAIADIEPDPFRVRYRLAGTKMVQYTRVDFTGRYLDEFDWPVVPVALKIFRAVWETGKPVFGILPSEFTIGGWYRIGFGVWPLAAPYGAPAGPVGVGKCLLIEDYEDRDARDLIRRDGAPVKDA